MLFLIFVIIKAGVLILSSNTTKDFRRDVGWWASCLALKKEAWGRVFRFSSTFGVSAKEGGEDDDNKVRPRRRKSIGFKLGEFDHDGAIDDKCHRNQTIQNDNVSKKFLFKMFF